MQGHFKDLPELWNDLEVVKSGFAVHGTSKKNMVLIQKQVCF